MAARSQVLQIHFFPALFDLLYCMWMMDMLDFRRRKEIVVLWAAALSLLLAGCATRTDRVQIDRRMSRAQERADLVLALENWDGIKVLKSRAIREMPQGRFPFSDLQKYFPPGDTRRPLSLIVVFMSTNMPVEFEGRKNEDFVREIGVVLRENGVKRFMFQSELHGLLVETWPEVAKDKKKPNPIHPSPHFAN